MRNIEIAILNPDEINVAEKMLICSARLTQRGHKIKCLDDFMDLYNKSYTNTTVKNLLELPHTTIQKFGLINVVVVGASRRFLAQITRHQNEVKFMSASLQYSDYSNDSDFVVPYNLLDTEAEKTYIEQCKKSMNTYKNIIDTGIDNDSAGYLAPQGLRNVLIISATLYQWKYMIGLRVCRRNSDETRYIMLKIWEALFNLNPVLFSDCGPFCISLKHNGLCKEGAMSCGKRLEASTPTALLRCDFPLIERTEAYENKNH